MRRVQTRRLYLELLESRVVLNSYFVAPSGNDHNAGTSAAPWLTLQHAGDTVVAGDTVTVRAGTYAGFSLGWNFAQSGTASAPITFQADPGVVINSRNPNTADGIDLEGSSYITITGFQVLNPASGGTITRAGIRAVWNGTVNAQGVIIENCRADNCGEWGIFTGHDDNLLIANNVASNSQTQHGIYVSNACVNPVVRDNVVFGNHECGIQLNGDLSQGGTGLIIGATIEGNIIHDNGLGGGAAINCDGVQASFIENNLLYNNHASGIALFRIDGAAGSINNVVANNTVLVASNGRWALLIMNGSTGNIVFNNILYNFNASHGSINIISDSLAGFTSNDNIVEGRFTADGGTTTLTLSQWQTQTGQDLNSSISTPAALFVNPTTNDYHLVSTSPAIDAGVSQLASHLAPTVDLADTTRPQGNGWDIGAYEFVKPVSVLPGPGLVGMISGSGQWWAAVSNGSSGFNNALWAAWSPALTWVDVHTGDFNGDGKTDIIARALETGEWWVGINTGSSFVTTRWATWSPAVTWVDVQVGDFTGDGKTDIAGRVLQSGDWWMGTSTGSSFLTSRWATWSPMVTWVDVHVGDFTGDGRSDIVGRPAQTGQWWVGVSTGSSFTTSLWANWSSAFTWVDIQVGDFTGTGKSDIIGRMLESGQWWVGVSTGVSFTTTLWATWSPAVTWVDVRVGDFNGDGKADIIGRDLASGNWWVGLSTGSAFTTSWWAQWSPAVTWVDVQVGDFNGDGKDDITGRILQSGDWWTGVSTGSGFSTTKWGAWSPAVSWVNVRFGSKI